MREAEYDELLAWAMPRVGLRWPGFRRVKRQVCRRVAARVQELGLASARSYAEHLQAHPEEWATFETLCGVTISRFYRDRPVFDCLAEHVFPSLLGADPLHAWSAGCASGEEPYSIALMWALELSPRFPGQALDVLATDRDPHLLERAAHGCYRRSSLRELPQKLVEHGFTGTDDKWCVDPVVRRSVRFVQQDLRRELPSARFDLILCRNLAFSYFAADEQHRVLRELVARLTPGGYLVIGLNEALPGDRAGLQPVPYCSYIFRAV